MGLHPDLHLSDSFHMWFVSFAAGAVLLCGGSVGECDEASVAYTRSARPRLTSCGCRSQSPIKPTSSEVPHQSQAFPDKYVCASMWMRRIHFTSRSDQPTTLIEHIACLHSLQTFETQNHTPHPTLNSILA